VDEAGTEARAGGALGVASVGTHGSRFAATTAGAGVLAGATEGRAGFGGG
jgi:hypothetical protein